jgi:3-hydroxyisobutyrate dehydrogenase-like beta-hydroxyacid dehydrogenase
MYRTGMIGLGKTGMPIACNPMEGGSEIIGCRRHGSPEPAAAECVHNRASSALALSSGEPS